MKEEQKSPEVKEEPRDEAEATPSQTAPADTKSNTGDVQAYAEPSDGSGGGK